MLAIGDPEAADPSLVQGKIGDTRRAIGRLVDVFSDGLIEKTEFEPRVNALRERLRRLEAQRKTADVGDASDGELRLLIGRLQDFSAGIASKLGQADWRTKREIIRRLVKRIDVGPDAIEIVFRVGPSTPEAVSECVGNFASSSQASVALFVRR